MSYTLLECVFWQNLSKLLLMCFIMYIVKSSYHSAEGDWLATALLVASLKQLRYTRMLYHAKHLFPWIVLGYGTTSWRKFHDNFPSLLLKIYRKSVPYKYLTEYAAVCFGMKSIIPITDCCTHVYENLLWMPFNIVIQHAINPL